MNKILLLTLFLSVGCQSKEEASIQYNEVRKIKDTLEKSIFLEEEYQDINFPFNYSNTLLEEKYLKLNNYKLNFKDLEYFYSGEDNARVLRVFKKNIKNDEYLLSLVVINFNNYEGSGPTQVIFLSGGKLDQNEYKNTIFTPLGGWTPLIDDESNHDSSSFKRLTSTEVKKYCIQSFILEENLDKTEINRCTDGRAPVIKKLKFNSNFFGYDE
jgi:hypothetical protein